MEQQDLLLDLEQEIILEPATTGARFANFLIDLIVFYVLFAFTFFFLVKTLEVTSVTFFYYFWYYISLILYYTILEGVTGGKTLGKLITRTKVINEDGSAFSISNALTRSFCRIVPFEPFSAFGGYPWHDKWSKTRVVKQ